IHQSCISNMFSLLLNFLMNEMSTIFSISNRSILVSLERLQCRNTIVMERKYPMMMDISKKQFSFGIARGHREFRSNLREEKGSRRRSMEGKEIRSSIYLNLSWRLHHHDEMLRLEPPHAVEDQVLPAKYMARRGVSNALRQ